MTGGPAAPAAPPKSPAANPTDALRDISECCAIAPAGSQRHQKRQRRDADHPPERDRSEARQKYQPQRQPDQRTRQKPHDLANVTITQSPPQDRQRADDVEGDDGHDHLHRRQYGRRDRHIDQRRSEAREAAHHARHEDRRDEDRQALEARDGLKRRDHGRARRPIRPSCCRTACRPLASGLDQSRLTPSQSTIALAT